MEIGLSLDGTQVQIVVLHYQVQLLILILLLRQISHFMQAGYSVVLEKLTIQNYDNVLLEMKIMSSITGQMKMIME